MFNCLRNNQIAFHSGYIPFYNPNFFLITITLVNILKS